MISLTISILLSYLCNGEISEDLLTRSVTSEQILQKDENGNCYHPPFCHLNITQCNIPKISINDLTFSEFHDKYYVPQKPVIIQFCPDKSVVCDLSSVIDTSSNLFEWHNIASLILSPQEYDTLLSTDHNGTCSDRSSVTTITELDPRDDHDKEIYHSIHQPPFFDQIDIYNDLIGFLSTSDKHPVTSNKWVVFGTAGGGATFHFDYYFSSFWNLVVSGSKYWVLIDPKDVMDIWDINEPIQEIEDMKNFEFFDNIYLNGVLEDKEYECIQEEGDMMYVPAVFFHITANLERTLSVSQNIISKKDYAKSLHLISDIKYERIYWMDDAQYGIGEKLELCVALNHYDEQLFENSVCATNQFLKKLDEDMRGGSKLYVDSCNFAKIHSQYSDFR